MSVTNSAEIIYLLNLPLIPIQPGTRIPFILNSFLASSVFCRLLMTFANSLDPDQDPDLLGEIRTLIYWGLSGRVLDSRRRGGGFESQWRHCVVSLSKTFIFP